MSSSTSYNLRENAYSCMISLRSRLAAVTSWVQIPTGACSRDPKKFETAVIKVVSKPMDEFKSFVKTAK